METILELLESINSNFPMIELIKSNSGWRETGYMFKFEGAPMGYNAYLAINYSTVPSMTPGLVRCEDEPEALMFLNILKDRIESGEPFDYQKVLEAASGTYHDAMASAANSHSDEYDPESLPYEGQAPYWVLEGISIPNNAYITYTANWSDIYGHTSDVPTPKDTDRHESKSILFHIVADNGGEIEVELSDGETNYFGLEEGGLEWFLWCQLFCHNKNLAEEKPQYAYFRYDIMGGVWLLPEPQNLEMFPKIIKRDDFKGFAHGWCREKDEDFVILEWLNAVQMNLEQDENMDDEEFEKCKRMIEEYREKYCSGVC